VVDLAALRGSVEGRDPAACTYFTHFFVLLTLEHLTELRGFRSRWGFRKAWELVNFGLCFLNMKVDEIISSRDDSRGMPLPGWPNTGSQVVAFKLPWKCTQETIRIKQSESMLISNGDPLKSCIVEGSVQNIDFVERRMVLCLNGCLPADPWGQKKYRLDVYANRTTYERQVVALLEFAGGKRSQICDMLVAAEVGQVDLAVLGGDGFGADKNKLGGKADTGVAPEEGSEERVRELALQTIDHWNDDDWFTASLEKEKRAKGIDLAAQAERKAKVLKLAGDDVDGVDAERLAEASAQVESMGSVSVAQKDAIGSSMSKRLTIVQGPPGTGIPTLQSGSLPCG